MANLSPAERARMYKERAAAAGIGRPPAAGQDGDAAAAAAPPPPPAPKPAAPAAAGGGAAGLSPDQRQRLAAAVQRGPAERPAAAAAAPAAAAKAGNSAAEAQSQRLVYVWPHLVTIEFMAAVLLLVSMIVIAIVIQSPLEGHANADKTPNPSKAPWYFLNLQELLLHMHPALAGVIVPAVALGLIAIIPYFDRDPKDVGKWFGTPKALSIAWFTSWFSTVVLIGLVFFDEFVGQKPLMNNLARNTGLSFLNAPVMVDIVVPMILMNGPIAVLVWLLKKYYKPDNARDWMIALFTGFFVAYVVLTIVGTFMRGQGMHLMWPWDPKMIRVE
ncbi:MAG: menaquinol-cytochrome C reductase [Chloroflexi bacterium]|nr:menaquinol-cytochrome C reductase [Chloroflexota bacterium]